MREIKFRAWNGEEMLFVHQLDIYPDSVVCRVNCSVQSHYDKWPIMQYTGLKDKHGKEIYHKDFVQAGDDIMLVEWREDLASFALRKDGWAYDHYFGEAVDPGRCEVLGNIYQHPHLLKQEKV